LSSRVGANVGVGYNYFNGLVTITNATSNVVIALSNSNYNDSQDAPTASNMAVSSTVAGVDATFSALWTDIQSLSEGGFVFSTNNTGQWVNSSWTPFSSNPDWENYDLTLNDTVGAVVGFREYANNSVNLWGDSGIYAITTTASARLPTPTSSLTGTAEPTNKPTQHSELSPTLTPDQPKSVFTEIILITVVGVTVLLASIVWVLLRKPV
jgi:hypothetical protein